MIAAIDQTLPAIQDAMLNCPAGGSLRCSALYNNAERAYWQMRNQHFELAGAVPGQCSALFRRVSQLASEAGKWLPAYSPTPAEVGKWTYQASLWLLEARRVIVQEPDTCR